MDKLSIWPGREEKGSEVLWGAFAIVYKYHFPELNKLCLIEGTFHWGVKTGAISSIFREYMPQSHYGPDRSCIKMIWQKEIATLLCQNPECSSSRWIIFHSKMSSRFSHFNLFIRWKLDTFIKAEGKDWNIGSTPDKLCYLRQVAWLLSASVSPFLNWRWCLFLWQD